MPTIKNMFGVVLSRGEDDEKINAYKTDTLPVFEKMCTEAGGKWLMGTDDPTHLDITFGSMWDIIFLMDKGAYSDVGEKLKIKENAPNWVAYMEKFRSHAVLKDHCFIEKASDAHGVRSRGWDKEQKCQLSLEVLKGCE